MVRRVLLSLGLSFILAGCATTGHLAGCGLGVGVAGAQEAAQLGLTLATLGRVPLPGPAALISQAAALLSYLIQAGSCLGNGLQTAGTPSDPPVPAVAQ